MDLSKAFDRSPYDLLIAKLFNIFINNLFLRLTKSDLHKFADDYTIAVTCNNLNDLPHTLEKESESVIDWFRKNNMMVHHDKLES